MGVVPETTVECFDSAVVLETPSLSLSYSEATYLGRLSTNFLQKSCELVARYTELENKQIQLNLDLKLAQENLKKAQEEAKGMVIRPKRIHNFCLLHATFG